MHGLANPKNKLRWLTLHNSITMNGTKNINFACIIALNTHSMLIYFSKLNLLHTNHKGKMLTKLLASVKYFRVTLINLVPQT